jgi:hypothetical protein
MAIDSFQTNCDFTLFKRFVATKKMISLCDHKLRKLHDQGPDNKLCDHNHILTCDHILDTKLCYHKPDNKLGGVLRIVDPSFLLATPFLHL